MKTSKVIGFACYEIIDETSQPTFSIGDLNENMIRFRLSACRTQLDVAELVEKFPSLAGLIRKVAQELNHPHKDFIDKIILLS
jgi:hypothetical protein